MLRSICGPRTSLRGPRCASGSDMILVAGMNFDAVTRPRYIGIVIDFGNSALLPSEDGSHLFFQRMMRLTTTRSF